MTTVRLRVAKDLEASTATALAQIVSSTGRVVYHGSVPAGADATPLVVQLEPGDFLVRATLPSGHVITHSFDVGVEPLVIDLRAPGSRHEWLGWHTFVAGEGTVQPPKYAANRPSLAEELSDSEEQPTLFIVSGDRPPQRLVLPLHGDHRVTVGSTLFQVKVRSDSQYLLFRLAASDEGNPQSWPRVYLGASLPGAPYRIVALPTPWIGDAGFSGAREVEVLIARPPDRSLLGSRPGVIASLVVRDPLIGPVLGYLASGNPNAAATLCRQAYNAVDQLRDLALGERVMVASPYAVAALAYAVLRSSSSYGTERAGPVTALPKNELVGLFTSLYSRPWSDPEEWNARLRLTLADPFPWLPDGAVICGWHYLLDAGNPESLTHARSYLLQACRRGIPVFTEGVRLLTQGLASVAAFTEYAEDGELARALKRARTFGVATDPTKPFTTMNESDPTRLRTPGRDPAPVVPANAFARLS
jgi:hypothetical protein